MEEMITMINPCKECIVTSMCNEPCDQLKQYVCCFLEQCNGGKTPREITVGLAAKSFREGKIVLDRKLPWGYKYINGKPM